MRMKMYIKKIKTFDRNSGEIGQEVVVRNPDGYSCSVRCVDKCIKDFSGIEPGEHTLICEPDFYLVKGERYYQNILGVRVLDIE